jgi:hypothetical protein
VPRLTKNGKIRVTVIRDGATLSLDIPAMHAGDFLIRELNGKYPAYFVYGPLVFTSVSLESADQLFQLQRDPFSPLVQRRNDRARFPGEELTAVTAIFPHKCLEGYPSPLGRIVETVDGVSVKNLRHLAELLKNGKNAFAALELAGERGEVIVLARENMERVTADVMKENGIPRRRGP